MPPITMSRTLSVVGGLVGSDRIITSGTITATKDSALMANTSPGPEAMISAPAMAGPITRARLNWAEFQAMAFTRASGGTSDGTTAIHVGLLKARASPWANDRGMTAASEA